MATIRRNTKPDQPAQTPPSESGTRTSMPQRAGKRALAAGLRESPLSHEQIARRAYEIWQAKGRPQGSDLANWLEAIEALKLESKR